MFDVNRIIVLWNRLFINELLKKKKKTGNNKLILLVSTYNVYLRNPTIKC